MINWGTVIISLASAVLVALLNSLLKTKEQERERKIKAYSDFLNLARGFINDPNLSKRELYDHQMGFIKKYYNEIWLSASPDVVKAVDNFFRSTSITHSNPDEATQSLQNLVIALRTDLELNNLGLENVEYRIYTPNTDTLDRDRPNESISTF